MNSIKNENDSEIIILGIDTTSKNCSICLTSNNKIFAEYNFLSNNDLSSNIILIIDFLLSRLYLKLSDIDAIGIGIGPGIFTGIRVGMSTVKGLMFDSEKKIVPVNILQSIAMKHRDSNKLIVPMIDAKRDQVYIAGYTNGEPGVKEFIEPSLIEISELGTLLNKEEEYCFVGSGSIIFEEFLKANFSNSICLKRTDFFAAEIANITYSEIITGGGILDIEKIYPLYIRRTDAEENYERNNKKDKII